MSSSWGNVAWGKDYQNTIRSFKIEVSLNTHENYETRSVDILNKVAFPNLQTSREHQLATLLYKVKNRMASNNLTEIFTNTNEIRIMRIVKEFPSAQVAIPCYVQYFLRRICLRVLSVV